MAAASRALLLLLSLGLAFGAGSCVVDNDSIEGKECDLDADPFKACIRGYECQCEAQGCYCRKAEELSSGLTLPPARSATEQKSRLLDDPSARFLIRLGLEID